MAGYTLDVTPWFGVAINEAHRNTVRARTYEP